KKAYVANALSGFVSVLSIAEQRVIRKVKVGVEPRGVVLTPNGKKLYVANSVSNSVSVIDTQNDEVVATVEIPESAGSNPRALAVTNDGDADDGDERVLVALFFASLRPGKTGLDEVQDDNREGRLVEIATKDDSLIGSVSLQPIADTSFKSNG